VEIHTGAYAEAKGKAQARELERIHRAVQTAREIGIGIHAGHGLTYRNVSRIAAIPEIEELNIGHSIISRAVLVGLERAVREMKALVNP